VKSSKPDQGWRRRLENGDEFELHKWVKESGVECVARVAAALADAGRQRGNVEKLLSLLLLKIAHLKRKQPGRKLHPIADEVAAEAYPHWKRGACTSLTTTLERDFRKNRHTWMILSNIRPSPSQQQIAEDLEKPKSTVELRACARIVESLPSAIDAYDWILREAKSINDETLRRVKRLGRERIESMFANAAKRMTENPYPLTDPRWGGKIPRTFLDLIEPELKSTAREP
jgi:hypothetical protein